MKSATTNIMNGVDTDRMKETIAAVKASPKMGGFKFRIENRWINGGENQSQALAFSGGGEEIKHKVGFTIVADEPEMLLGNDRAANPVEYLLHALASCITTSMVYHAAARGITIQRVESELEGDLDLQGFLGLDPSVRNGFQQIRLKLRIKANVTDDELQDLARLGPTFSPVFDSITKGVPVSVSSERMK